MKNHEEMTASVFRRKAEYEAAQKRQRTQWARLAASVACCCLAVLAAMTLGPHGPTPELPTPDIGTVQPTVPSQDAVALRPTSEPEAPPTQPAPESDPTQEATNDFCDILYSISLNPLGDRPAGAQLYFDPALYSTENLDAPAMADYLGFDLTGLNLGCEGIPGTNCRLIRNSEGAIVYDTMGYYYEGIGMTVNLSRIGSPYDCVYPEIEDAPSQFYLTSGEVLEAYLYADGAGRYVADFSLRGTQFRVNCDTCESENDFAMLVRQIMDFVAA